MKTPRHRIGHIIKEYRDKKFLTQKELGANFGKIQKDITRYETGKILPRREVWPALCKALDMPLDIYFADVLPFTDADTVSESKKQTYRNVKLKPLTEFINLVQKHRELVFESGFNELLKEFDNMPLEKRKIIIKSLKKSLLKIKHKEN
jgi:transcriptional regulator with XRE-family HTH domain